MNLLYSFSMGAIDTHTYTHIHIAQQQQQAGLQQLLVSNIVLLLSSFFFFALSFCSHYSFAFDSVAFCHPLRLALPFFSIFICLGFCSVGHRGLHVTCLNKFLVPPPCRHARIINRLNLLLLLFYSFFFLFFLFAQP